MYKEEYWVNLGRCFDVSLGNDINLPKARPHMHDPYEVMLVLSQGVTCRVNNQEFPVPAGSILIFNNADLHGLTVEKGQPYIRYVTYFEPEFIAHLSTMQTQLLDCFYCRFAENPWLLPLSEEQCAQFRQLLDQTIALKNEDGDAYGNDLLLRMRLAEVLICVNKFYRKYHGISEKQLGLEPFYGMLNYIHQHLDEKITLDALAEQFCVARREFSRQFHNVTGMSLGEYIVKCRIMHATDALLQGMRVEDVCEKVGFQNLSHFSRTFKKYMGVSPKQYAKQHM